MLEIDFPEQIARIAEFLDLSSGFVISNGSFIPHTI